MARFSCAGSDVSPVAEVRGMISGASEADKRGASGAVSFRAAGDAGSAAAGGRMLCFAFGADLDPEVLRARAPDRQSIGLAALRDQRLGFPRFSSEWEGGV